MREQRLVFGEDAEEFDRVRSSYPARLVDDVVALVGLPCRAVDAGCGTGKATVLLAMRGVDGVGVEPDEAMAAVARRNLAEWRGWRVEVSDFEDWEPPADTTFDLVTCAQAWHWIDRARGTRQAEQLLRSGGWLAIFGNRPDPPDTPLRREIDAAYAEHAPAPSMRSRAPAERVGPGAAFRRPLVREYASHRDYSAAEWTDLLRTSSDHRILQRDQREALFAAVTAAIERHGGTYRHHVVHELWAAQRR